MPQKPHYIESEQDTHPREIEGVPSVCAYCSHRQLRDSQVINLVGRHWECELQMPRKELRKECVFYEREPGCDDDTPAPAPVIVKHAVPAQRDPLVQWLWEVTALDSGRTSVCHELLTEAGARTRFAGRQIRRLEDTRHVQGVPG